MGLLVPSSALLVDDEAHLRTYMKLMLRSVGVETFHEAANLTEARALWALYKPGLVVLDVNLPGEKGLVFLNEVRAKDEEAYVVMFSADAQAATVKEALAGGADGFIRKDSPKEQIVEELTEIFTTEE